MHSGQRLKKKQEKERELVSFMIGLYCRKKHKTEELCPECRELLDYAYQRIEHCPFMEKKTFCSSCRSHCYRGNKRDKIKEIMRWSGPRLLFYRPMDCLRHMRESIRNKTK